MKLLTFLCVLGLTIAGPTFAPEPKKDLSLTPTEEEILKIIGGILYGVGMDLVTTDIAPCLTDVEGIGDDLFVAVEDFRKKDPDDVKNGIKECGEALESVPSAISDCKSGWAPEVAKLRSMIAIFSSPTSFAYDVGKSLLLNGHDIYDEIKAAVDAWESQNWWAFGENVGEALGKCFIS
jgi:hypothetical protein